MAVNVVPNDGNNDRLADSLTASGLFVCASAKASRAGTHQTCVSRHFKVQISAAQARSIIGDVQLGGGRLFLDLERTQLFRSAALWRAVAPDAGEVRRMPLLH